jgi:hypothetical protein
MAPSQKIVVILLGEQFDEVLVILLCDRVWQAAGTVKLVARSTRPVRGLRGLTLVPDLTVAQALRMPRPVSGIVLPCTLPHLHFLRDEPRYPYLIQHLSGTHTLVMVTEVAMVPEVRHLLDLAADKIVVIDAHPFEAVTHIMSHLERVIP